VYRGQGLSSTDFEKLLKAKGGLISFNNFLSTSPYSDGPCNFALSASQATDMVPVLFEMTIDPSVSSAPFASLREISYFQAEEEILFSMHTVFRIGEISKIFDESPIYVVDLQLTADDDQQLRTLTECIRKEVAGETGWRRLGLLLVRIGHFHKAEELYNVLLEQTSNQDEKSLYYNNLGCIKNDLGEYEKAIHNYEQALEISKKNSSSRSSRFGYLLQQYWWGV
jgi:tetratricopeptide (TPR) repeat protein